MSETQQTLHFRLRSIETYHKRFLDFASHFICFKILQINFTTERLILSMSKYSTYIFGDEMNSSQLELCQERGRVELLWQFQIFYLGILVQLFAINICHFRSLQWRGPQWKSLFWAYEKPHQAKNQFSVKPPSWFSLNMFYWEMGSYFWTLFKSKKKHSNDPLTYSALLRHNGPSSCLLTPCQHIWVIYLGFRVWSLDKPLQELPILTPISIYVQDSVRPQSNCRSVVEGPN